MGGVVFLAVALAQAALIAFMVWDRRSERREAAVERAMLLQRIQAPELAVVRHDFSELPQSPLPLPFDDDEAFHASREEMAAALERNAQ
jgi:hypothetical protein